jgi:hypothetical protein
MNFLKARSARFSRHRDDAGMTTAEYAVGTVSACGFGGLLYQLLSSDFGKQLLEGIFDKVTSLLPF